MKLLAVADVERVGLGVGVRVAKASRVTADRMGARDLELKAAVGLQKPDRRDLLGRPAADVQRPGLDLAVVAAARRPGVDDLQPPRAASVLAEPCIEIAFHQLLGRPLGFERLAASRLLKQRIFNVFGVIKAHREARGRARGDVDLNADRLGDTERRHHDGGRHAGGVVVGDSHRGGARQHVDKLGREHAARHLVESARRQARFVHRWHADQAAVDLDAFDDLAGLFTRARDRFDTRQLGPIADKTGRGDRRGDDLFGF